MKILVSLCFAAAALVLSSCTGYHAYGSGHGRGYTASTLSIHGRSGYYPSSSRSYGYSSPYRSYYPSRSVYSTPRQGVYRSGHQVSDRGRTQPSRDAGHGRRDRRSATNPSQRGQRSTPADRGGQRSRGGSQPTAVTMASYRQASPQQGRSSRSGSSSEGTSSRGSRGGGSAPRSGSSRGARGR